MSKGNRRELGTGSLFQKGPFWQATIRLVDDKRVTRQRRTKEEAEEALQEILTAYADRLGYHYRGWPRHPELRGIGPHRARHGMSPRTRWLVLKRDAFACQYCGRAAPNVILHVDHIVAVANGGTSELDNLRTACAECNQGKRDD